MPARNRYHQHVRHALIQDGWTITHDPLRLAWGLKDLYVDLGAERFLAAEKAERRIAVEIHSFLRPSEMEDLEKAVGQFVVYSDVLAQVSPDRTLYLAIPEVAFASLFQEPIGTLLLTNGRLRLLIFDPQKEVIRRWIP
jgi:hypothetical protein